MNAKGQVQLGSIDGAKAKFGFRSRRAMYDYFKKNPDLLERCRVELGPRAVRYRLDVIDDHIADLPTGGKLQKVERLERGKERKRAAEVQRDRAAPWTRTDVQAGLVVRSNSGSTP
jgi:hypothetical protein